MKAWRVDSEDGETRFFATKALATTYAKRWAKDYAADTGSTMSEVLKDIGPHPHEIDIAETLDDDASE